MKKGRLNASPNTLPKFSHNLRCTLPQGSLQDRDGGSPRQSPARNLINVYQCAGEGRVLTFNPSFTVIS